MGAAIKNWRPRRRGFARGGEPADSGIKRGILTDSFYIFVPDFSIETSLLPRHYGCRQASYYTRYHTGDFHEDRRMVDFVNSMTMRGFVAADVGAHKLLPLRSKASRQAGTVNRCGSMTRAARNRLTGEDAPGSQTEGRWSDLSAPGRSRRLRRPARLEHYIFLELTVTMVSSTYPFALRGGLQPAGSSHRIERG